jgi:RpiR family transcriptional regulator, carbohydrate utilization regulator
MSGMTIKMRSILKELPVSERDTAVFALNNISKVPYLSIYDVAKSANVSVAAVSRLAKKVGCKSFKEFKVELAQDIESGISAVHQGITNKDSDKECVRKVFGSNITSLQDTLKIVDIASLIEAAEAIVSGKRVIFFGFGSSGYIAMDAALRFSHLGIDAQAYANNLELIIKALSIPQDEVVVGISHSGRSEIILKAMELAAKRGALTIGISNYPKSPLHKICKILLCTAFSESLVRAAAVSSRVSQICLIDALQVLVARNMKDLGVAARMNKIVEEEFRSGNKRRKGAF